jgi:hypothetical protein
VPMTPGYGSETKPPSVTGAQPPWRYATSQLQPSTTGMPTNDLTMQSNYMQYIPIMIPNMVQYQAGASVATYDAWDPALLEPYTTHRVTSLVLAHRAINK